MLRPAFYADTNPNAGRHADADRDGNAIRDADGYADPDSNADTHSLADAIRHRCDGVSDAVENQYGSNPNDPLSTPESGLYDTNFNTSTCSDNTDNDLDGMTDQNDPGCQPQPP